MIIEIVLTGVFCITVFYAHIFIKKLLTDELNR